MMKYIEIVVLRIKRMRGYFFIPLILVFILHPAYIILNGIYGNGLIIYSSAGEEFLSESVLLYPFAGLLWPIWYLYDSIESCERELTLFYHKIIYPDLIVLFLLYSVIIVVGCKIYSMFIYIEWIDYYIMAIESVTLFGYGLIYYLAYRIKNMPVVLLVLLIYFFGICVSDNESLMRYSYTRLFNMNVERGLSSMFIMVLLTCFMFYNGAKYNGLYRSW